MVNKREFKKQVDALGASVIDEMVSSFYNVEGADKDKITEAIQEVLGAVGAAKSHANIFFDKGVKAFESKKEYADEKKKFFRALFDKIETEFNERVNSALKTFNSALPESVKAHNKEVANS